MATSTIRGVALPLGEVVPAQGQGTWHLAAGRHPPDEEIAALRLGIDLGMTLIDTALAYTHPRGRARPGSIMTAACAVA